MSILDNIVADKINEVVLQKSLVPVRELELSPYFEKPANSLADSLRKSNSGIIAEHKRRSPSKSVINDKITLKEVAVGYETAGVSAMSVLTDNKYFGGNLKDLTEAREHCMLPLLRKEFVIDEYQILEAKANGADAILLIAAILKKSDLKQFSELAKSLQLDVLLEVHDEQELSKSLIPSIDMLGVNNRNLKTFEVTIETSKKLSGFIPDEFVKVSESGINSSENIKELKTYGFQGFLIGEHFMKSTNPGESARQFINQLVS